MADILAAIADARGSEAALIDEFGTTSWGDLDQRVNRLIDALRKAGLGHASKVAVLMGNRREFFEILSACAHASMVAVPINWHLAAEEVRYVLDNSDAEALFVDERFADLGVQATDDSPLALRVLVGGQATDDLPNYEPFLAAASAAPPPDQGEGGVMFYTSGTTGRPKGVRRLGDLGGPLAAAKLMSQGFCATLGVPPAGTTLLCGPLYHSAQWAFSYLPFAAGSSIVMRHKFDAAETLRLIDEHAVSNVHLVPTQFVRLLRLPENQRQSFDASSLQIVLHGAAPCRTEVKQAMIDWWGQVISEYYGGTEGAVISIISAAEWQRHPHSVGKPLPNVEVMVVDDEGRRCTPGSAGQLYFRNRMAADFEYYKEPQKTASVHLEPGVFTMGDVGYLDEDGYIVLTDRKIDMIISGGVNIYPAEVERVLSRHPAVSDVAVFGVPDEEFGEQVKAAVELEPGTVANAALTEDLIAFCRRHLASYKAPKTIDFESSLPRHPTGKLYKRLLREPYWQRHQRPI